jgi:hypothetical protein
MSLHESTSQLLELYSDSHDSEYKYKLGLYEIKLRAETVTDPAWISERLYEWNFKTIEHRVLLLNIMSAKKDSDKVELINDMQRLLKVDLDECVNDLIKDRYFEIMTQRAEDL